MRLDQASMNVARKSVSDSCLSEEEIVQFHDELDVDFGTTDPVEVVQRGVLKVACGYHNGSTCSRILYHHGLIKVKRNGKEKLTRRGQQYLWESFKDTFFP